MSDSHRINHQSQYQLYCPESECHQQGITNGIHVDILGYCIDLHLTTTLEHVIDEIKRPTKQSWSAKQGALVLQGSQNRQLSSMTHWRERTPSITLVMLFLKYLTLKYDRLVCHVSYGWGQRTVKAFNLNNHGLVSKIGMPSLGSINMHPSIKSCQYSLSIS